MRINRPSIALGAFLAITIVTLVACASGGGTILSTVGNAVPGPGYYDDGGATAAPAPAASAPTGQAPNDVGNLVDDAKIVRTGSIDLQVTDVVKATRIARDGIRAMGGYIGASQTSTEDERPVATVTYRIPVDRWEDALDLLRGLSGQTTKVVNERTEAVEVTGAVVDLEARIRNLRASEAALQGIASKAARVSDVLEVQAQLTSVRGEIEQLSAQLKDLNDRAAYATLTASFAVPVVAVEVAAKGWEPAQVVDEATASLVDILQALTTAGIWFAIVWLPILVGLGLIGLAAALMLRRLGVIGRSRQPTGDVPAIS
ncbi:MAG TPA: DUF4349 domain-containing protein [Candidatus Limnocylindrales bacterium]|jgi:hypothetical protein|nr:DUF4349 domain-containing protein [Candidatus Limnocylindrales bacterium]